MEESVAAFKAIGTAMMFVPAGLLNATPPAAENDAELVLVVVNRGMEIVPVVAVWRIDPPELTAVKLPSKPKVD